MKFTLIGFGEVGSRFAAALLEGGQAVRAYVRHPEKLQTLTVYVRHPEKLQGSGGVRVVDSLSAALEGADVVISAVWASAAEEVAEQACRGAAAYIDVTNVGIEATQRMSRLPGFHKGAVLAPVARHGAKSPMLLAGPEAERLAGILNASGFNVRAVGTEPRQAAAIKILRSVATKCIVALLHDMTEAARAYGVEDQVLESAGEFFATEPFADLARTLLRQSAIHAERLAGEMDEIGEALRAVGGPERVPDLAREVFLEIARQSG
jgi:3-hydroxyisobutyrate dehydrogenase-like beta-hydroxyacid dehydrogenase